MKKLLVLMAILMAACFVMPAMAQPALASGSDSGVAKLTYGPDKWIDLHLLFQMQYTNKYTWNPENVLDKSDPKNPLPIPGTGETESDGVWASDFAPKRMRVMFNGQVAENLTFFVETDIYNDSLERYSLFLQDAYFNYKVADELQIAFGMILLPFMHHNRQSAVSLLGVNYNTAAVNIAESTVWRDYGVEFRGLLANKMIDYRIGVFDGIERKVDKAVGSSDDINPKGLPRVTGRVQVNFMDAEDGFFYSGNYLGKKKIVSLGGGIDYMRDAREISGSVKDYLGWTVDLTVDYPINPTMVLAFQAAYVQLSNRPGSVSISGVTGLSMPEDETGYFAQLGLLINNTFQPVLKYSAWVFEDAAGGDDATLRYLTLGLNYFINGHNANIKMEYQMPIGNVASGLKQADIPNQQVFTIQAQLFI